MPLFLAAVLLTIPSFGQTLREMAEERGILVGAAVDPNRLSEPLYASTLSAEFNLI
ncbi:MAG: endo-1,4-beta-xylanase, partial [Candidatus Solibacter usitatus]|nr:endo-1,4-beta-xylanase [Candidatus Solibacter usitatus]